ncbi:hypothetical protein Gotur_023967 [Gossypium turneri]
MKFKDGYPLVILSRYILILPLDTSFLDMSGPVTPLPDLVTIHPPKDEEESKEKKEYEAVVPPTNIEVPVLV